MGMTLWLSQGTLTLPCLLGQQLSLELWFILHPLPASLFTLPLTVPSPRDRYSTHQAFLCEQRLGETSAKGTEPPPPPPAPAPSWFGCVGQS